MEANTYILSPHIALRSWRMVPYAYYIKGVRRAAGLSQDEFMLLLKCDGKQMLEDSQLLRDLVERGMCIPCENGAVLTEWQKPMLCVNRYFPGMSWEITARCNCNCLHCFNAVDNSPSFAEFTWEECERLMDEAQACGVNSISIIGGEPMVHPRFMDILRGIHQRGMMVERIYTNCTLLTQAMLDEMKSFGCKPTIKTSFDVLGHHDWMRNCKGAEEKALAAIRLCIQNRFPVVVHTNIHRLNLERLMETAELLDKMGVSELRIIRTTESPRWVQNSDSLCPGGACLSFEEYFETALEFARDYVTKPHRMTVDVWQFLDIYPLHRQYRIVSVAYNKGEYRDSRPVCGGNRGSVRVTAGGELVPCQQISGYYEKHGIKLGNVKRQELKSLLSEGTYVDEICTSVGQLAAHNETCRTCRWWEHCAGGCRAIGLALTGDRFGEDKAKCAFFNGGYMEKIAKVFEGTGYSRV